MRCDKDGCKECAKTSTGLENRRIVDGVCVCKDEYKDPTNSIVCLDQIILGGDNCPPGIP